MLRGNLPVLLVALGMTLVVVTGEIDISVGSTFALCGVAAGILSKSGLPVWLAGAAACLVGAAVGSLNAAVVAYAGIPSVPVTLATMTAPRGRLPWAPDGARGPDPPLPAQRLGLAHACFPLG